MRERKENDDARLIDFALTDQFGREHRRAEYEGAVLVVVGTDRGGSAHVAGWLELARDGLEELSTAGRLRALGVADLRGGPALVRPVVRAALARVVDRPVLLDWTGRFATAYGFEPGACTVLVADADGRIVHRTSGGAADPALVAPLVRRLRALLGAAP
jgi:uncharacterized protein YfaP (DUF2135 family)